MDNPENYDEIIKHQYYFKEKFRIIKNEIKYLQDCYSTNRQLINEILHNQKLILHKLLIMEKKNG